MNPERDPVVENRDEMGDLDAGRRSGPLHLLAESRPWRWEIALILIAPMLGAFSFVAVSGLAHIDTDSCTSPDRGRARGPRGQRCAAMLPVALSLQNTPVLGITKGTHAFPPDRYPAD